MQIIRLTVIVLVALGFAAGVSSQQPAPKAKPDFSGRWALDRSKTNVQVLVDRTLQTVHQEPEFRYFYVYEENGQSKQGENFIYYTDGRGEKNQSTSVLSTSSRPANGPKTGDLTESKTRWEGNKIEIRSTLRANVVGQSLEFDLIDEWKLSDDGQTLTHTNRTIYRGGASTFMPAGRADSKWVYRKMTR
jgi:hypothetical protein